MCNGKFPPGVLLRMRALEMAASSGASTEGTVARAQLYLVFMLGSENLEKLDAAMADSPQLAREGRQRQLRNPVIGFGLHSYSYGELAQMHPIQFEPHMAERAELALRAVGLDLALGTHQIAHWIDTGSYGP